MANDYKVGRNKPPVSTATQIKKGEVRNPHGGRLHKSSMIGSAVKALTAQEIKSLYEIILKKDESALDEIIDDDKATVLMKWVAKAARVGMDRGDMVALEAFFARMVGKVPDKVEHLGEAQQKTVIVLPSNGRELKTVIVDGPTPKIPDATN